MAALSDVQPLPLRVGGSAVTLAIGVNVATAAFVAMIVLAGLVPINGQTHPAISIAAGIPLMFPLYLLAHGLNSGVVTADAVVIKKTRWSRPKVIPLSDVVAVGMIYTIQPRINGWRSYVWQVTGEAASLPLGLSMSPSPGSVGAEVELRDSRQGQLCREVFDRVSSFQGSSGLVVMDREVARRGTQKREQAYWSVNPALPGIHMYRP